MWSPLLLFDSNYFKIAFKLPAIDRPVVLTRLPMPRHRKMVYKGLPETVFGCARFGEATGR
jgi:hypothetical protein